MVWENTQAPKALVCGTLPHCAGSLRVAVAVSLPSLSPLEGLRERIWGLSLSRSACG